MGLIDTDNNLFLTEKEIFNKLAKEKLNGITGLTTETNFLYYYKVFYITRKL